VSYVTFTLISEKVGIAGSEPWPFGLPISDAVMGLATGLLTSLSFCGLAPFMATRTRLTRSTRRVRFAMFTIWTVVAVVITFGCEPYSNFTPKRLAVLHQHDANVANTDDAVTFLVGARASDVASSFRCSTHDEGGLWLDAPGDATSRRRSRTVFESREVTAVEHERADATHVGDRGRGEGG
jgi:hypothetical protein